jgi:hypothetical protein
MEERGMSHGQIDPNILVHELALLRQQFRAGYRHIDEHLLEESIEDALLHYLDNPGCFDASRGASLHCYLAWQTRSCLYRHLRGEARHRQHEKAAGVWEKDFEEIVPEARAERSIYLGRDRSEQEAEVRKEELDRERVILSAIAALLDPWEQAGVQLLLEGVSHEEWVLHLEIEQLPQKEQHHRVNQEKDRLKKKLKRRVQKMQGGNRSIGVRVRAS